MLDGTPRLNLASFVTTWMEPECDKLIMASINKNYVDMDEYPVTTELQVHFHSFMIFFFFFFFFFFFLILLHFNVLLGASCQKKKVRTTANDQFIGYCQTWHKLQLSSERASIAWWRLSILLLFIFLLLTTYLLLEYQAIGSNFLFLKNKSLSFLVFRDKSAEL